MEQTNSPIRRYRIDKGQRLTALAAEIGVDKTALSRWENGQVPIPPKHVPKVSQITGIPMADLRPDIFAEPAA